ncbi:MAG: PAS domain-containing protein [Nitrospiraceae bacterium]
MGALAFTTLQGAFREANRAFLALTGRTREEILDMTYQSLTQAEYRARNADVVDQLVRTGRPVEFDKEYIVKDGARINVSIRLFWFRGSDGKQIGIGSIVKPSAKNIGQPQE